MENKEPRRVILISTAEKELDPTPAYGGEVVVYNLADALKDMDGIEEVAVACCQHSRLPKGVTYIPTVEPKEDPHHDWFAEEEQAYEIYKPYLKDFDVISSHSWFGYPYIYKLSNPEARVCHTFHGMHPFNQNPPFSGDLFYIAASFAQKMIVENILRKPCRVIWHGIDTEAYQPVDNPSLDYYLFLNRVMREKGAMEFIDICEECEIRGVLAGEDVFVGDQNYVEVVKQRCEKSDFVEYRGKISFKEKVQLMQNAKATIGLPIIPYTEIFGLFVCESLACGTPVIALRNGGLIDQLTTDSPEPPNIAGLLCDNTEHLKQLVKGFEKTNLTSFRESSREVAEEVFSKEAMAARYHGLFSEMLK